MHVGFRGIICNFLSRFVMIEVMLVRVGSVRLIMCVRELIAVMVMSVSAVTRGAAYLGSGLLQEESLVSQSTAAVNKPVQPLSSVFVNS